MWIGLLSGVILKKSIGSAFRKSINHPFGETRLAITLWRAISSDSSSSSPYYRYPVTGTAPARSLQVLLRRFSSSNYDPESNGGDNVDAATGTGGTADKERKEEEGGDGSAAKMTFTEAKKLMRLVNVESLKLKLGIEGKEVIGYEELLEACESMGVARSRDEASTFAHVLDEAGVVLLFRDKVYLHPDKVVDLVRRAVPLALTPENDPMREELKCLQAKKEEIDVMAHKQVLRILWTGLGFAVIQAGLFFRLTFWEFSWDVMEPIAFFTTTAGIVIGYAYFLFTARDPTYQDLRKRLFLSRQRKLLTKHDFDVKRFKELQCKCKTPLDANASIRNRVGLELDLEDSFHRDY